MKRKALILIVLGVLFFALFIFLSKTNKTETLGVVKEKNGNQISETEKKKLIKENTEKYQPKMTKNTKEVGLDLSAKSVILVDQNTNEIIYQKNPNEQLPPASIAKILTFSIIFENFKEDDLIEISQRASEQISNKINMKPGEKLKASDLLYGLMMISANDAAYAFADASNGGFDSFMKKMDQRINLLGLANTKIKSPAGLDEVGQYTSSFDMATITRYALKNFPLTKYAGKTKEHSVFMTEHNEPHWWFGHLSHMLKAYPGMVAAKTGYTDEARSTYVGVAERNGRQLVVIILGSQNANQDVKSLLDFGFSH